MFCVPILVFSGSEDVGSCFHVLRSRTRFWRCGGRRVHFSCFALPHSFSAIPRASGLVFMFCAPGHVFDGMEGIGSHFHVLRSLTHFRRCGGHQVPFSCFAFSDSFSAVPRASGLVLLFCVPYSISTVPTASAPIFILCTHGHVFGSAEGVRSRFHVLRPHTRFRWYLGRRVPFSCFALSDSFSAVPRASGPVFMFCSPRLVFSDT
jgi:hypothetical protein